MAAGNKLTPFLVRRLHGSVMTECRACYSDTIARFDHLRPSDALAQIGLDVQHEVQPVAQRRASFRSKRNCVCDVRS